MFVFGQQVITRKPSYLKLTKGDTKEKVTKERSSWLKLHWLVKFVLSNRATGVWPVGFVGEKVNVLIEKRKVSLVHVLSKAWIWSFYVVVLQTAWLFQKSFSVFLWFWYCARAPAPTPSVDMKWLVLVVDSKNFPRDCTTPLPCMPKGLRVLKVAILQKSSWPFADLYITYM